MSKFVKNLITQELSSRLEGVEDALLVNVIGMDANSTVALRRQLREKNINLLVIKNSLARRAAEGTSLENAFVEMEGALALIWGCEDIISLAKEVVQLDKAPEFKAFAARGGVMAGEHLSAERVHEISKWPNRDEQLSILSGQICSPGAQLASQLEAPGGLLVSQLDKIADGEVGGGDE
ncbi:MAG: 50S ribosomal protein L10 [Pirellulaceae bacterium]|jgi:ribosomal protein L10|nr:50S ribosomal protein L10 [Pirellulaceae bacterium]MDP7018503.1 50S ribosomal protein L10 [Pirellulaceae bacterium]